MRTVIGELDVIFCDFDGVLTDNTVYVDGDGNETVRFSKHDSIGFDILKDYNIDVIIISSEKSKIVTERAKKLGILCYNGIHDKEEELIRICDKLNFRLINTMYIGNDINDLKPMSICGYRVGPSDSHYKIKEIINIHLSSKGGHGVIRELVELKLGLSPTTF